MIEMLRVAWTLVRAALPSFWDLHIYGGGAVVAYGTWLIYPPAGMIVLGLILMGLGLWVALPPEGRGR